MAKKKEKIDKTLKRLLKEAGWWQGEHHHYHFYFKGKIYDCGCELPYKDKITPCR